MKNSKGFTLIELLVTMVIVGILAVISVSTFGNYINNAHQGKSYALQGQINTLIQTDCINQGYSCNLNIVPNWAFSEGDTGEWIPTSRYTINQYRLTHPLRIPGSTAVDYITVPLNGVMVNGGVYRVDAIARKVDSGTLTISSPFGFSASAGVLGYETEDNKHICDVFEKTMAHGGAIRLFVRAGVNVEFDEVSVREVNGGSASDNCSLGIGIQ